MLINKKTLMKILNFQLGLGEDEINYALEVAKLLTSPERTVELNKILAKCMRRGWVDGALSTVDLLNRKLTPVELNKILAKCVRRGWVRDARLTVGLLNRKLTPVELNKILAKCVRRGSLSSAMTIVMLMDKPDRTVGLNKILAKCLIMSNCYGRGDWDNYALEVAKLLTSPEIAKKLFRKIL